MTEDVRQAAYREGKGMVKFIIVGGLSFLIFSGTYFALTRWIFTGASLTLMNMLALCISAMFNFTAHRVWTYRATHAAGHTQIGRYLGVVISAALLQAGLFWLAVERFRFPDLLVLVPIAGICAFYTYFAHKLFTFKAQNRN